MNHIFQGAAGSVIGREHQRVGKNNQDAYFWGCQAQTWVAVVCDGCSSSPHSEVGAKLFAPIVGQELITQAQQRAVDATEFWPRVQTRLLTRLRSLIDAHLGEDASERQRCDFSRNYFLFTIVGAILTPEVTALFALGDGVLMLNGESISLPKHRDNAPPYLAYGGMASFQAEAQAGAYDLQVHRILPTMAVQSLLVGSDGVQDLIAAADRLLPGKADRVGEVSQFWMDDRFFKNPDYLRRRLFVINQESVRADWATQQVVRSPGLLPDDTTLITVRRCESGT